MFSSKLLRLTRDILKECRSVYKRHYATILSEHFGVSQFSSVVVTTPYKISVQPIDVFSAQDKISVSVESKDPTTKATVKCEKKGDTVYINSSPDDKNKDFVMKVYASVKANLDITGFDAPIDIGSFYGRSILAKSHTGDITLLQSQCENISLTTKGGNIVCKDVIQAGDLQLHTKLKGSITSDRLQALTLRATTTSGDITVGSCYSDSSLFSTDFGILRLKNLHKNVEICINHEGLLNITGLDGCLKAKIKKGLADIQVERFEKSSEIVMEDSGSLILRLSEECQKNTFVKLMTNNFVVGEDVKMKSEKDANMGILIPTGNHEVDSSIIADCKNGHILVDSSSWTTMFEHSFNKV